MHSEIGANVSSETIIDAMDTTNVADINRLNRCNFKFVFDRTTTRITKRNLLENCTTQIDLQIGSKISKTKFYM